MCRQLHYSADNQPPPRDMPVTAVPSDDLVIAILMTSHTRTRTRTRTHTHTLTHTHTHTHTLTWFVEHVVTRSGGHPHEQVALFRTCGGWQVLSHTQSHDAVSSRRPAGQLNELLHSQLHVPSSNVYMGGQESGPLHRQLHEALSYSYKQRKSGYVETIIYVLTKRLI